MYKPLQDLVAIRRSCAWCTFPAPRNVGAAMSSYASSKAMIQRDQVKNRPRLWIVHAEARGDIKPGDTLDQSSSATPASRWRSTRSGVDDVPCDAGEPDHRPPPPGAIGAYGAELVLAARCRWRMIGARRCRRVRDERASSLSQFARSGSSRRTSKPAGSMARRSEPGRPFCLQHGHHRHHHRHLGLPRGADPGDPDTSAVPEQGSRITESAK